MKKLAQALTTVASATMLVTSASAYGSKQKQDIIDTALAAGSFTTLAAALTEADLVPVLRGEGPFTVFAPTDEAFAKLPEGTVESLLKPENRDRLIAVLTYHVADGRRDAAELIRDGATRTLNGQQVKLRTDGSDVTVGGAAVVRADVMASNGVIHVIDSVLLPETETIVGVAGETGTFKTLLAAAKAAGLADALGGEGPFTVFAPTDDAFSNLPAGTVESLLRPENRESLSAVLEYHVAAGRAYSAEVLARGSIETLAGLEVTISSENGVARVNGAKLVATDIDASNGVIHVIDTVLLPPQKQSSAASPADPVELAIRRGVDGAYPAIHRTSL